MVLDARSASRARPGRPGRPRLLPANGRSWANGLGRDLLAAIGTALGLAQAERRWAGRSGAATPGLRLRSARDEFLGLISHELRTPVTTIYGNALLLLSRPARMSAEEQLMIGDIAADSERLLGLIDNLLALARIEAGTALYREPVLLTHHLRAACESLAQRRGREVLVAVKGGGDIVVEADHLQLGILITNLLGNAMAYSRAETPVEVVLEVAGSEARVSVLDRGIGVGADQAGRLAMPFFRRLEARRITSGLGIGLTVCRRIVEAHGGRLWARPRPGGGANVGFGLPLMSDPDS
jgi:two-component system sensor histidine kinase KdpD